MDRLRLIYNEDPPSLDDSIISGPQNTDPTLENEGSLENTETKKIPQYFAAITATLSALCAGLVIGWTSPILLDLEHGNFHNITIDKNQIGWIGSFATLGGMSMCIPTGFICDLIGRKKTLLLLIVPFTIGWSLIVFSKTILMLYFGRFITGMASGASCVAAPLYVGEIAQKDIRGALGAYFQLMVTIGILLAYFFGKFLGCFNYTVFCACFPLVFVMLFAFQPETPVYYVKKGRFSDASASLKRLRGNTADIGQEIDEIRALDSSLSSASFRDTIAKRAVYKGFLIVFGLMFIQQFCGVNAIIMYTSDIFTSAGVNLDANTAAIIVGTFQVMATFASSLIVDKLGRKVLLFTSALAMGLSTFMIALFFTLKNHAIIDAIVISKIAFIPVVFVCLFIILFSIGFGPIPWMISAEIFTPEIRSIASSGAGTINWFLAFVITKFYLQVNDLIGIDTTYYCFSVVSIVASAFVHFIVPETKGKTVEQVQAELER